GPRPCASGESDSYRGQNSLRAEFGREGRRAGRPVLADVAWRAVASADSDPWQHRERPDPPAEGRLGRQPEPRFKGRGVHPPEVELRPEVAVLWVEVAQARGFADEPGLHRRPGEEHRPPLAVVGPLRPILLDRPPQLTQHHPP